MGSWKSQTQLSYYTKTAATIYCHFLIVLELFLCGSVLFLSSFARFPCDLMIIFTVMFGSLSLYCVYNYYKFLVWLLWGLYVVIYVIYILLSDSFLMFKCILTVLYFNLGLLLFLTSYFTFILCVCIPLLGPDLSHDRFDRPH